MTISPKFDFKLFDNFPELCFIISDEGKIISLNKAAEEILGINSDKLVNTRFFDLAVNDDKAKLTSLFSNHLGDDRPKHTKAKFSSSSGESIVTNISFIKIKDENDNLSGFNLILAKDITETLKKDNDLLQYYSVAENTVNPLQITDLEGKMVYVNKAFINASGYTKEELIGKRPAVFGSGKHSKKFWAKMWKTISSGKVWVGEVENKRKNGEAYFTQLLISPILDKDNNVTGFFGVHRDLTEKKMLEKQLVHTQKMESIGTLAAGVAHEVGNPLASISALVQVIQRSTSDEFAKEKLELVKSQVTRISKIIRDLVDFSRPSNYELQLTDINHNINEAVDIIKVGAKSKTVKFITDLNNQLPFLPLVADQVQQVFVNILLNAVDVLMEEPKDENIIVVKSDVDEDNVIVTFSDNGKGIQEENYAKVFEPFFTTKKEGKGTGLGLWVSYGIIKSFQGDIKVNSIVGVGTTFTVILPIQP
jgi:PAS domain S-box-containing protein